MEHERFKHFERPTAATLRQPYAKTILFVAISALLLFGFVLVTEYPRIMEFLIDSGFISGNVIRHDTIAVTSGAPYELYAVYENSIAFITPTDHGGESSVDHHAFTYGIAVTSNGWFLFPVLLDAADKDAFSIQFQDKTYSVSELRTDSLEGISAIKISLSNARPVEFLRSTRDYESVMFSIGRPPESLFRVSSVNSLKEPSILFTEEGKFAGLITKSAGALDEMRESTALAVYPVIRRLITSES